MSYGARLRLSVGALTQIGDLPQHVMRTELAWRRIYLHTTRWTSLGLSLIEAMALGMPVWRCVISGSKGSCSIGMSC